MTYVHIVTSNFHDIWHEKNSYRAALVLEVLIKHCLAMYNVFFHVSPYHGFNFTLTVAEILFAWIL